MHTSAIREMVTLAEHISPPDLNVHMQKVNRVQARINRIKSLLNGLLGVEAEARRTLESQLRDAQSSQENLTRESEQLRKLEKISGTYQRLSLEPLTWRDAEGLPRLVIFTLTSSLFRLVAMPSNDFRVEPKLPQNIAKQYQDVLGLLATKRSKRKGLELICQFEGLIPSEIRGKIKEAQGLFDNQIFIVAEPGSFTFNKITLPKRDPLIIGYDQDADGLWLIADFNTTPVEEAMIFHFDNN